MHTSPIQIYAIGDQYHAIEDTIAHTGEQSLPNLKTLTQAIAGTTVRRVGRFIQLALIGALRCNSDTAKISADTAVFFSSARGDLQLTSEIIADLFRNSQIPKPLGFINTVSNAACYYVAQLLSLQSPSNYVCNRHFAFESALQLAMLDLSQHHIRSALVGSVDIATLPLAEHRQRLRLAANTRVGEGSHWLWVGEPNNLYPRLGEIINAQQFPDRSALLDWCTGVQTESLAISRGQFINDDEWQLIAATVRHNTEFNYREHRAYYDSHSGAVISEFLRSDCSARELLHINTDDDGRFAVILVRRP